MLFGFTRTRRKLSTLKPFYPISDDDDVAAQPFMPSLPESSVMCGKLIMDGVMAGCSPVRIMFCGIQFAGSDSSLDF